MWLPLLLLFVFLTSSLASGTASFSDSYIDKLSATRDEEGFVLYESYPTGSFSFRGRIPLAEPLPTTLNPETPVSLSLGAWSVEGTVAQSSYKAGKRAASFKDANTGAVIKLAWTTKALTWSVTGRTGMTKNGDSLEESPAAAGYTDLDTGQISSEDQDPISCELSFGDVVYSGALPWKGSVKQRTRTFGRGDDAEELNFSTISMKGSGPIQPGPAPDEGDPQN